MSAIERHLQDRYPHWFHGRRARVVRPLLRGLQRWSRLDRAEAFLAEHGGLRGFDFVRAALAHLGATHHAAPADIALIPAQGRLLVVANHPSGALDALALLDCVGRVRQDVRIVANDLLSMLDGLQPLLLPVRILGGTPGASSLAAIEQALEREQCVIVFPAGEVSRLGLRGIADTRWRRGVVRFARRTGAPVLPVRIQTRNSALFYGASAVFKPAGTVLLAREMYTPRRQPITLAFGQPRQLPADVPAELLLRALRRELYGLSKRRKPGRLPVADAGDATGPEALAEPVDPQQVAAGIAALDLLGSTRDGRQIRVGRLAADAPLLRELGRLRELTFRAVGEGTGRALDLDRYDAWYEHIVLWDAPTARVVGAYRVARGARVLAERGLGGFYTAALFRYGEAMLPKIAAGMELGRSFVVPDEWGGRSIDYLWQGIGAYLRRHPQVRHLFGPVSISAALPEAARAQIVGYYARYYGTTDSGDAISAQPFPCPSALPQFDGLDAETAFRVLRHNLDALGATLPMLYKQYTELCEPDGVRFLAFGIDPDFADAVDGLIEVDLQRLRPHKRRRYLGTTVTGEATA